MSATNCAVVPGLLLNELTSVDYAKCYRFYRLNQVLKMSRVTA